LFIATDFRYFCMRNSRQFGIIRSHQSTDAVPPTCLPDDTTRRGRCQQPRALRKMHPLGCRRAVCVADHVARQLIRGHCFPFERFGYAASASPTPQCCLRPRRRTMPPRSEWPAPEMHARRGATAGGACSLPNFAARGLDACSLWPVGNCAATPLVPDNDEVQARRLVKWILGRCSKVCLTLVPFV
jgi:hypothetical protein